MCYTIPMIITIDAAPLHRLLDARLEREAEAARAAAERRRTMDNLWPSYWEPPDIPEPLPVDEDELELEQLVRLAPPDPAEIRCAQCGCEVERPQVQQLVCWECMEALVPAWSGRI